MSPRVKIVLPALVVGLFACSDRTNDSGDTIATATRAAGGSAIPPSAPAPTARDDMSRGLRVSDVRGFSPLSATAEKSEEVEVSTASQGATSSTAQLPGMEALSSPMLIRTGQASVRVDSLGSGVTAVRALATRVGALIANTSVVAGDQQLRSATLELRVPSDRFDELVNGLSPLGKVETVNVYVQDVGEEYTDVAARVANAKRLEARLVELLANRTGRLADVLTVERELARVREEIERYEGRMRYLRTRTAYSSLTVTVHEKFPIVSAPPGSHPIAEAFREAWRRFVMVVAALIASMGVLIPVAAIAGGAWVLVRRSRASHRIVVPQE
jgi:hypothetical protein